MMDWSFPNRNTMYASIMFDLNGLQLSYRSTILKGKGGVLYSRSYLVSYRVEGVAVTLGIAFSLSFFKKNFSWEIFGVNRVM